MANHNSNWSELHEDLLRMIMKKLSIFDLIRFSTVCSHWRSAVKNATSPALLAVSNSHVINLGFDDEKPYFKMLYLIRSKENEYYNFGSSKLMLIHLDKRTSSMPLVFNPFSETFYGFPSLQTMFEKQKKKKKSTINKAIVITISPTLIVLVVIYSCDDGTKGLAYSMPIDGCVTWVPLSEGSFSDVISSSDKETGDKVVIYAWSEPSGSVLSWVLRTDSCHQTRFVPGPASPLQKKFPYDRHDFEQRYLAVGPGPGGDELFLVRRFFGPIDMRPGKTLGFRLYTANYNSSPTWEKVKDFSGTVFVGSSETKLVMCSDPAKDDQAKGCVYFTDDNLDVNRRGYDVGVFSLEKKTLVVDLCKLSPSFLDPFWLT